MFRAFIEPSDQNQLYHTPLLSKIWVLTENKEIVNNPFKIHLVLIATTIGVMMTESTMRAPRTPADTFFHFSIFSLFWKRFMRGDPWSSTGVIVIMSQTKLSLIKRERGAFQKSPQRCFGVRFYVSDFLVTLLLAIFCSTDVMMLLQRIPDDY